MPGTQYVLTGFGDFFERRRVAFFEPLPIGCLCRACGFVCSSTVRLPCGHALCRLCKSRSASVCPVDCVNFEEADVVQQRTELSDLEQLRVYCINDHCDFVGKLAEVPSHVLECVNDEVKCGKCGVHVKRNAAVGHRRQCSVDVSIVGTTARSADVFVADRDAGGAVMLREHVSGDEHDDERDVANGSGNHTAEEMVIVQAASVRVKRTYTGALRSVSPYTSSSEGTMSRDVTPGPYRAVSKTGVFVTLCRFDRIYEKYGELRHKKATSSMVKGCVLGGYTFALKCTLARDTVDGNVEVVFWLYLGSGEWDNCVSWPFRKKVTAILTHPWDEAKDARLPFLMSKLSREDTIKKPAPIAGTWNTGYRTWDKYTWKQVETEGFIHNNVLYVYLELE
ncbi:hypothetical protein HPB50_000160 [Hyalomma asiaticum]|uniref:Uncharacterized protein n=1 Tax=Hyalomma asiaticum TaxID=266040 RepID=A0ACB7T9U7_HYAAI|nr:hypothetical protein HPB50_000160 [Hyalomma asiaticum]